MIIRLTSRIIDTIKAVVCLALVLSAVFFVYYLAILFIAFIVLMGGHLTV
ncbi:MAG: hypothetical protein IKN95_07070 [Lachnospiraceae bacterium]|nr:hypothetical protein [Lachnospiraceae bacterium]